LARLLGGDALRELFLFNGEDGEQLLDEPSATLLANALRANSTLTDLTLEAVNLWSDPAAAELLLHAATAHPSLRKLELHSNRVNASTQAIGRALGALVAANAPALEYVNLADCQLGEVGLGPLVEALPANTHLKTLRCYYNGVSAAFARERLLPAARANTSLRALVLINDGEDWLDDDQEPEAVVAVLEEIQDMVAARVAAA
jgi:Ran GTPase-activating protein (RanGAP) involved in mRNA processing and transport